MLSLGQLYTNDTNDNDDDNDKDNNTNDDENDTRQTNHDCIGSLACIPNEPKTSIVHNSSAVSQVAILGGDGIGIPSGIIPQSHAKSH